MIHVDLKALLFTFLQLSCGKWEPPKELGMSLEEARPSLRDDASPPACCSGPASGNAAL